MIGYLAIFQKLFTGLIYITKNTLITYTNGKQRRYLDIHLSWTRFDFEMEKNTIIS